MHLSPFARFVQCRAWLAVGVLVLGTTRFAIADEFDDRVMEFVGDPIGFVFEQEAPVVERVARAALSDESLDAGQRALIFDCLSFAYHSISAEGKAQEVLEERVMGGLTDPLSNPAHFSPPYRAFHKEVRAGAAAKLAHVEQQLTKADRQLKDKNYEAARVTVNNVLVVNPRSNEARNLLDTISRAQAAEEAGGGGSNMMLIAGGGAVLVGGAVFLLAGGDDAGPVDELGTVEVTVDIPPN